MDIFSNFTQNHIFFMPSPFLPEFLTYFCSNCNFFELFWKNTYFNIFPDFKINISTKKIHICGRSTNKKSKTIKMNTKCKTCFSILQKFNILRFIFKNSRWLSKTFQHQKNLSQFLWYLHELSNLNWHIL